MGLNSSFITNYCTQLTFDLTQQNLLSLGYQKLSSHSDLPSLDEHRQLYQHYQTKRLYSLQTITSSYDQGNVLIKALQSLEMIKNGHLCNVLFSSINTTPYHIINRKTQIKVFVEHSSLTFPMLLKHKSKSQSTSESHSQFNFPYSNIEIATFARNLHAILSEIQNLSLPISQIHPQQFLIGPQQSGELKYSIDFQQFLNHGLNYTQNHYFAPEIWQKPAQSISFQATQIQWKQNYEKNLVFSFGNIFLHFLLLQPLYDCYNYKSKQFCQSQLQNKLNHLSKILQARYQKKQRQRSTNQLGFSTEMTEIHMERLNTETKIEDSQPFQLILYELIIQMLCENKQSRLTIDELKLRTKKLTQKIAQEYTMAKNEITSNIQKAHEFAPKIKSISNQSHAESFNDLSLIKISSGNQINTTHSRSRSMVSHLKPRQVTDRQKLMDKSRQENSVMETNRKSKNDKQNISNNNDLNRSDVKSLKGSIRKLCGYKKMKISENSFMEGYFQNDKAHGLGKITRRNGQTIECIFHNNQIIESISASPKR